MTFFCIFKAKGEGDGYTIYDFVFASQNLEKCKKTLSLITWIDWSRIDPVHPSMKKENNYMFLGQREECHSLCKCGHFGGFVIELVEFDNLDSKWKSF